MKKHANRRETGKMHDLNVGIRTVDFFLCFFASALVVLLPFTTGKILAASVLLILAGNNHTISRHTIMAVLAVCFITAYILSPYWIVPAISEKHCLGGIIGQTFSKTLLISLLLLIGLLWVQLASGEITTTHIKKQDSSKDWIPQLLLVFGIIAFNYIAMGNNIAVEGDEEWHIWRWDVLRGIISPLFTGKNSTVIIGTTVLLVGFFYWFKRIPAYIKIFAAAAAAMSVCLCAGIPNAPNLDYLLVRYPFFSCWLHQLGPVWNSNRFDESMYRIIPLLSTIAISLFIMRRLQTEGVSRLNALLIAIAICLTPNIYYHSTMLYLELPAVAMFTAALYYIEPLLKNDFKQIKTCPGWYALLIAGFIKETLMIIIAGIICMRLLMCIYILFRNKRLNLRNVFEEFAAAFCMAAPLGIYIVFRMFFASVRSFEPHYSNLTDIKLYIIAGKAIWEQFGGLLILAAGGIAVSLLKKRFLTTISLTVLFVIHFIFYFLDRPEYVGLARFNLPLFSILAVFSVILTVWIANKSQKMLVCVGVFCMAVNLILSPVAPGGEKKTAFAFPAMNSGEYYYPHQEAMEWLKDNRQNWPVLVSGHYSKVRINWYFAKAQYQCQFFVSMLKPGTPYMQGLKNTLDTAGKANVPLVLFHKANNDTDLPKEELSVAGYKAVKIFKNRYSALILYQNEKL